MNPLFLLLIASAGVAYFLLRGKGSESGNGGDDDFDPDSGVIDPSGNDEDKARYRALYHPIKSNLIAWLDNLETAYNQMYQLDGRECGGHYFKARDQFRGFTQDIAKLKAWGRTRWYASDDFAYIYALWNSMVHGPWAAHVSGLKTDNRSCAGLIEDNLNNVNLISNQLTGLPEQLDDFYDDPINPFYPEPRF